MIREFNVLEVTRALGVAPSTGSIIAGLLNGHVNPDNCRSVEYWPMVELGVPPQGLKVLTAIASLLEEADGVNLLDTEDGPRWYIRGLDGQPTVMWVKEGNYFEFVSVK
jgi:hypothetical protein